MAISHRHRTSVNSTDDLSNFICADPKHYLEHDHPMYTVCPDLLSMTGETSSGILVRFIELDEDLNIFYLFT